MINDLDTSVSHTSLSGVNGVWSLAQMVKNLPAIQETWVRSLGREDPLEKGMAHSSILAWRIPWQKGLVSYSPWGCKESDMTELLILKYFSFPLHVHKILISSAVKFVFASSLHRNVTFAFHCLSQTTGSTCSHPLRGSSAMDSF